MSDSAYSVTRLTELIRNQLESAFTDITVEGEISNCRPSSTGHLYFTLKDAASALSVVMFRNRYKNLTFVPSDGLSVRASGAISVYAARGSYQLVCENLALAGQGDIFALLEERKRRLAEEGLFDAARKVPIPRFPRKVGIVSSPTGAALRDILNVLKRRSRVDVVLLPAPVQGTDAAPIIARRIEQANAWELCDVLIVGRGGGSSEDLLPFSEESVVRAIAASRLPIISAVGHEIDWALSDFAADLRAPTPSAAAELVSPDREAVRAELRSQLDELISRFEARLDRAKLLIKPFSDSNLEFRFRALLQPYLVRFDDAKEALGGAIGQRLDQARQKRALAERTLSAYNPKAVLERGFSVVTDELTGKLVVDAAKLQSGQTLVVTPARGRYKVSVTEGGEG